MEEAKNIIYDSLSKWSKNLEEEQMEAIANKVAEDLLNNGYLKV